MGLWCSYCGRRGGTRSRLRGSSPWRTITCLQTVFSDHAERAPSRDASIVGAIGPSLEHLARNVRSVSTRSAPSWFQCLNTPRSMAESRCSQICLFLRTLRRALVVKTNCLVDNPYTRMAFTKPAYYSSELTTRAPRHSRRLQHSRRSSRHVRRSRSAPRPDTCVSLVVRIPASASWYGTPRSRALNNSAIACHVLWSILPEFGTD